MFHPGDTLNQGAYRIERELGAGGFGVVYLAEEVRLRRQVAIKTLLPDLVAREPGLAEAFYAEARLTAGLAHPHILPILFVGEEARGDERCPYIVMEYIEGGDLEAVLTQGRGDLPQRLRWMRQIADGLAYAHAQGVIHRDLKPRNVFLTRTNTAKIGDFGLAKVMGAETQTFLKGLGTAAYIAPEQVQGRPADARADLYALGVMYYQILTGHLPYDAPGVSDVVAKIMAICYQHVNAPVPSARAQNPDISPALDALIQRLMAKTPEARPASAAEVIPLLEACLLPAPPPGGPTQTARPAALGGAAPVPAVDSARDHGSPATETASAPAHPPLAATQAVAPPRRRFPFKWLAIPIGVVVLVGGAAYLWTTHWEGPPASVPLARSQAVEAVKQAEADAARKQAETARLQGEEAQKRLQAEVDATRKQAEAARRQTEAERQKLQAEVDAARKQVEELRLAKLRDEQQRQQDAKQAEEARLKAEAEQKRREAEAQQARVEEQRRQAEAQRIKEAHAAKARAEEAQKAAEAARFLDPAELKQEIAQGLRNSGITGLTVAVGPDRIVHLSGAVESRQKMDQALKLVNSTAGVARVRDRIVVTAGCHEPAPAPTYVVGEEWTWRDAKGGWWSERVVAEGSIVQIKRNNGELLYFDKDRVLQKVVKSAGAALTRGLTAYGVIGARLLDFPLQLGKAWQYDVPSRDKAGNALPIIDRVTVVACEEVATSAGKFPAFKMEFASTKRGEPPGEKGVAYRWYAPRVKHMIKRQYVPSPWWSGDSFQDYELIRYLSE